MVDEQEEEKKKEPCIPTLSDEELVRRYARIKPLVMFKAQLYGVKDHDWRTVSYNWIHAEPRTPADVVENLRYVDEITTYHTYAYYGIFRPTVAEVLAQIPDHMLSAVVAFYITDARVHDDDYHAATTYLYGHLRP